MSSHGIRPNHFLVESMYCLLNFGSVLIPDTGTHSATSENRRLESDFVIWVPISHRI